MLSKPWPICVHDEEEERLMHDIERIDAILEKNLKETVKDRVLGPEATRATQVLGLMPAFDAWMRELAKCDCEVMRVHQDDHDGRVTILLRPRYELIGDFWKRMFLAFVRNPNGNREWTNAWRCDVRVLAQQSGQDLYALSCQLDRTVLYAERRRSERRGMQWVVGVLGGALPTQNCDLHRTPRTSACRRGARAGSTAGTSKERCACFRAPRCELPSSPKRAGPEERSGLYEPFGPSERSSMLKLKPCRGPGIRGGRKPVYRTSLENQTLMLLSSLKSHSA